MNLGFRSADILLPKRELDHTKWSVVACDQYTSEPEYWSEVERIVGDAPSTYDLILPEVYLENEDVQNRLDHIKDSMEAYMAKAIFDEYKDAMVYVQRTDSNGNIREGIVGAIDLEEYDYHKGSSSLVRATESTVIERIPPRIKVRKNAPIELPHIMILIDDPEKTVIEPCADKDLEVVYDFDLMQGGGHLKGALLDQASQEAIAKALKALGSKEHFEEMYHIEDTPVLLYAMGDGNHSLATAKEFYEQLKAANPDQDLSDHPARYALAEIVNLHSPALEFSAIHRIVTGVDFEDLLAKAAEEIGLERLTEEAYRQGLSQLEEGRQITTALIQGEKVRYEITKPISKLTVGSLQKFLDEYLEKNGGKIDYIHGADVTMNLSKQEKSIGFLLPILKKEELFPTVIVDGALPRKTFSMGHAQDKRYYMECRKIR